MKAGSIRDGSERPRDNPVRGEKRLGEYVERIGG